MKLNILLILSILVSVGLFWLVTKRTKDQEKERKRQRFQDIKRRVTTDVLEEYRGEISKVQTLIDTAQTQIKTFESEFTDVQAKQVEKKAQVDACQDAKKRVTDDLGSAESEANAFKAELQKEKASWETEAASLKQQKSDRSKVCDFVKKGTEASKLCGEEYEVPKAEAPKQEEPKAEAPKQEEPKAEAPKQEEPKAEAPKQEEPKAEAPKRR